MSFKKVLLSTVFGLSLFAPQFDACAMKAETADDSQRRATPTKASPHNTPSIEEFLGAYGAIIPSLEIKECSLVRTAEGKFILVPKAIVGSFEKLHQEVFSSIKVYNYHFPNQKGLEPFYVLSYNLVQAKLGEQLDTKEKLNRRIHDKSLLIGGTLDSSRCVGFVIRSETTGQLIISPVHTGRSIPKKRADKPITYLPQLVEIDASMIHNGALPILNGPGHLFIDYAQHEVIHFRGILKESVQQEPSTTAPRQEPLVLDADEEGFLVEIETRDGKTQLVPITKVPSLQVAGTPLSIRPTFPHHIVQLLRKQYPSPTSGSVLTKEIPSRSGVMLISMTDDRQPGSVIITGEHQTSSLQVPPSMLSLLPQILNLLTPTSFQMKKILEADASHFNITQCV